jgi:hypothetical protein
MTSDDGDDGDDGDDDPLNWDDLDPISLEPVCSLPVWFELQDHAPEEEQKQQNRKKKQWRRRKSRRRRRRYDAWAWLEMLVRAPERRHLHPVTNAPLAVCDRRACWAACAATRPASRTPAQQALLDTCASRRVTRTIHRHDNGRLRRVELVPVSPLLDLRIDPQNYWCKWVRLPSGAPVQKPAWVAGFNCEAAIQFDLVDADDAVVARRKLWI